MRPRLSSSAAEDDGDADADADGDYDRDCHSSTLPIQVAPDSNSTIRNTSKCDAAGGNGSLETQSSSTQDSSNTSDASTRLNASQYIRKSFDSRKSIEVPDTARSRRPSNTVWKPGEPRNGSLGKNGSLKSTVISVPPVEIIDIDKMSAQFHGRRSRFRSPWFNSLLTVAVTALAIVSIGLIVQSFTTTQLDAKGCRMSYMRPAFAKLEDFDTEHTRFASKYSVYLYREVMVDEDTKV